MFIGDDGSGGHEVLPEPPPKKKEETPEGDE
jgi:hypothetical protein